MFTGLVSLIMGLLSGALPKVLTEVSATRDHQREMEFLRLQNQLQLERMKVDANSKIRSDDQSLLIEELHATRDQVTAIVEAQGRPTGIRWVDGFNALLRPTVTTGIIALFFWISVVYVQGVMAEYQLGHINVSQLATAIWGSLVGDGILSVFGFLFGYRSTRR